MRVPIFARSHRSGSSARVPAPRGGRVARLAVGGATALATIVGSAILAQPANAATNTLFVSTTGSDANNCLLIGTACATLAHALTVAASDTGDTIMISPG